MSKRVLFLQGPLGPFFSKLGEFIRNSASTQAFHITFNGGDEHFADPAITTPYTEHPDKWESFLSEFISQHDVTDILVYGDCRFYHRKASEVAKQMGVNFWVFEEGYIRPSYITLEQNGVNGNSSLIDLDYDQLNQLSVDDSLANEEESKNVFGLTAQYALKYYFQKQLKSKKYPHYIHHRPWLAGEELMFWLRAGARKMAYSKRDAKLMQRFVSELSGKYFLVPLQVSVDSQILYHSPYRSVEEFIGVVIKSFAENASADDVLLFKHHPMDRGFNNYAKYIKKLCYAYDVSGRVFYCHDTHLPTLLKNAKGTVTLNSTVGLSSLHHGTATKVLGSAIYDIEKVTSQKTLDQFWRDCCRPCKQTLTKFKNLLKHENQISGSFYHTSQGTVEAVYEKICNQ